jgi:adenosylcobinamide kinase/adenosylcobinamide-phosphate guanylyltransferase
VGLGIVPENKLARDFRDIAGKVNQIVAKEAKRVIFMASGIPMKIKG